MRHKKVSLFGMNFLKFYWLLKNKSICIGKRNNKLKFLGVIYQIWLIGSKFMLQWIKKLLSKSAQKRLISTYQIKWKHGCTIRINFFVFVIKNDDWLSNFSFFIKGKVKFENKRGNSSENAKKIDEFQEKQVKLGVSDKFSIILILNGLWPKF